MVPMDYPYLDGSTVMEAFGSSSSLLTMTTVTQEVLSNKDIFDGVLLALVLSFLGAYLQGRNSSASDIVLWPTAMTAMLDKEEMTTTATPSKLKNSIDPSSPTPSPTDSTSDDDGTHRNDEIDEDGSKKPVVFDGTKWKEMSRPENYILYSTRVKRRLPLTPNNPVGRDMDLASTLRSSLSSLTNDSSTTTTDSGGSAPKKKKLEQKWVIIGLLVLFVPIFSIEFFFALSRQFICGGGGGMDYAVGLGAEVGDVGDVMGGSFADAGGKDLAPWARELCSAHFD